MTLVDMDENYKKDIEDIIKVNKAEYPTIKHFVNTWVKKGIDKFKKDFEKNIENNNIAEE